MQLTLSRAEAIAKFGSHWSVGHVSRKTGKVPEIWISEHLGPIAEWESADMVKNPKRQGGVFYSGEDALRIAREELAEEAEKRLQFLRREFAMFRSRIFLARMHLGLVRHAAKHREQINKFREELRLLPDFVANPNVTMIPNMVTISGYFPPETKLYRTSGAWVRNGVSLSVHELGNPNLDLEYNSGGAEYECCYYKTFRSMRGSRLEEAAANSQIDNNGGVYGEEIFFTEEGARKYLEDQVIVFLRESGEFGAPYLHAAGVEITAADEPGQLNDDPSGTTAFCDSTHDCSSGAAE